MVRPQRPASSARPPGPCSGSRSRPRPPRPLARSPTRNRADQGPCRVPHGPERRPAQGRAPTPTMKSWRGSIARASTALSRRSRGRMIALGRQGQAELTGSRCLPSSKATTSSRPDAGRRVLAVPIAAEPDGPLRRRPDRRDPGGGPGGGGEGQASRAPEVAGRVSRQKDGRIGRFGWKAQTPSLADFVLTACAVELGLEVPDHHQGGLPQAPEVKAKGLDLTDQECAALVAYVRSLPTPIGRVASVEAEAKTIAAGKGSFESIGCASCHTPKLGDGGRDLQRPTPPPDGSGAGRRRRL